MAKKIPSTDELINDLSVTGFGYDLLRYICLPDLLGKDSSILLYVMGKNLTRKFNINEIDELIHFFEKAGWGHLTLKKEKRKEYIFELTGELVTKRIDFDLEHDYRLEAGFLAEAMQQLKDVPCECMEEILVKKRTVQFTVLVST